MFYLESSVREMVMYHSVSQLRNDHTAVWDICGTTGDLLFLGIIIVMNLLFCLK